MKFATGDIILFSGHFEPHLRVQKFLRSIWSQVGLLIEREGRLAVFESTKVPVCKDVVTNEFVSGVQLVWYNEKVTAFNGRVAIRKLSPALTSQQVELLMRFVKQFIGRPYNDSKFFMVRGREHRNPVGDNSSFVCSQLVAEAFQQIGLLEKSPKGLPSGNFSPSDFSSNLNLKLINGFKLGTEQFIKA